MSFQSHFEQDAKASHEARVLNRHGLCSAAIFYHDKYAPLMLRAARVTRTTFYETDLPVYTNTILYPHGAWTPSIPNDDPNEYGLKVDRGGRYIFNERTFRQFIETIDDDFEQVILNRVAHDMKVYNVRPQDARFDSGGSHWVMDHEKMLRIGLSGYKAEIQDILKNSVDNQDHFYNAMLATVDGLITLAERVSAYLKKRYDKRPSRNLRALINSYDKVPIQPAETFFDAVVCAQFFMMYASVSEPGRMDRYLYPFFERDVKENGLTKEEAKQILEEFITNIDDRVHTAGAWHLVLGGTAETGQAAYNELTKILLEITGRHRQPNTSLRIRKDMPNELWEIALRNLGIGIGNPALVNDDVFQAGLKKHLQLSDADFADFAFGGCAETLVAGKTHSHSLASQLNLPDIMEECARIDLVASDTFESFKEKFYVRLAYAISELNNQITLKHRYWANYRTDTVRSLLTHGCLEKGKGYHQGGPLHNFENTTVLGFGNTVNSLFTIKKIIEGEAPIPLLSLPAMIKANYHGFENELAIIKKLSKYGNGDDEVNKLAQELGSFVFDTLNTYQCPDGIWKNTPSIIGYTNFVYAAKHVGATPDGRKQGEAFADSAGPMQGTNFDGPTALLRSVITLPQEDITGTCVLNILLSKDFFDTKENLEKVKQLFKTYFAQGGAYLQVNVVDKERLQEAMTHPEKHRDIIVRIGGYNDFFTTQSDAVKQEILRRTQHTLL